MTKSKKNKKHAHKKTRSKRGRGIGKSKPEKPEKVEKKQTKTKKKISFKDGDELVRKYSDEPRIYPDEFYYFDRRAIDRSLFKKRDKKANKKINSAATGRYYARRPEEQLIIDIKEMRDAHIKKEENKKDT